jgi:hypothetical protein
MQPHIVEDVATSRGHYKRRSSYLHFQQCWEHAKQRCVHGEEGDPVFALQGLAHKV